MPSIHDEILKEVRKLGKTCAVIKDRTVHIQEQVTGINGQVREHATEISRLTAETAAQEKDLDELKSTARGAGGTAGAVAGGFVGTAVAAALRIFWPSG